jgi:hypothetical protein
MIAMKNMNTIAMLPLFFNLRLCILLAAQLSALFRGLQRDRPETFYNCWLARY